MPRRFTPRLIAWTLLVVGCVYVAVIVTSNRRARALALAGAEDETNRATELVVSRVESVVEVVEARTRLLASVAARESGESDLAALLKGFVSGDERIWGGAVAFDPETVPPQARSVSYYHRDASQPGQIRFADLSTSSYRYWDRPWFANALDAEGAVWTEPYVDKGGGDVAMVTCSVPFKATVSQARGVVTADVRLAWLDTLLREVQVNAGGFAVLVARDGRVIAHSSGFRAGAGARMLDNVDDAVKARLEPVVKTMLSGDAGFQRIVLDGQALWLSFRPVVSVGWVLAEVTPEAEILREVNRLRVSQLSLSVLGLLLLAVAISLVSRRMTRGLVSLAHSAERMGTGDLETEVATLQTRDEIGILSRTLAEMRRALREYVENLRVATAAKERLESELRTARRIQADMLPEATAGGPDCTYELSAVLEPARQVGGDLFDHFEAGNRVFFLVGDVSGKGVGAALFMARAKTVFETVAPREADPGAILASVNSTLCRGNDGGMFVTVVCGWLNLESGELALALAGHDAPTIVRTDAPVGPLDLEGGRVLGIIEESDFPVGRIHLEPGEAILLSTDGVSEAQNAEEEFFGPERIVSALEGLRGGTSLDITRGVLGAVREFAGEAPQSDDITIMTVRFLGKC